MGAALFVILIWRAGPARILADIRRLSWSGFAILLAMRSAYWVLRTYGWRIVFAACDRPPRFSALLGARLADHAISYLTPTAMLGGGPIRALMIDAPSRRKVFATVVVDKTLEVATNAGFSVLAVVAAAILLPVPPLYRILLAAAAAAMVAAVAALVAGQKRGLFVPLLDLLLRLPVPKAALERQRDRLRDMDAHVAEFYRSAGRRIPTVILVYALMYVLWTAEVYATLRFLDVPGVTWLNSFLVVTLANVYYILPPVPASLGFYEITNVGIFALFGWGAPVALSLSLVRRILALLSAGGGLLAMLRRNVTWRGERPRPPAAA